MTGVARDTGDSLIEVLCAEGIDSSTTDSAAYKLLNEVFNGYPVRKLHRLVHSSQAGAVRAGAWLLSELPDQAASMLDDIEFLLGHSQRDARFFAIDAVLLGATEENGLLIAKTVTLIDDPDAAVRWKVMMFLSHASIPQLLSSIPYLALGLLTGSITWLASSSQTGADHQDILTRLDSSDRHTRVFATAAATRIAREDRTALEYAATSKDPEIKSFAESELNMPRHRSGGA
jgi:hypothetical protein